MARLSPTTLALKTPSAAYGLIRLAPFVAPLIAVLASLRRPKLMATRASTVKS